MKTSSKLSTTLRRNARKIVMALALAAVAGGIAAGPASAHEWDGRDVMQRHYAPAYRYQIRDRDVRHFGGFHFRHDDRSQRNEHVFRHG